VVQEAQLEAARRLPKYLDQPALPFHLKMARLRAVKPIRLRAARL
jgi:hypothetical protein